MNKILLCLFAFLLSQNTGLSQLKDDVYTFRKDMIVNYDLFVKHNDTSPDNLKIINVVKVSNDSHRFSLTISSDSSYINVYSINDTLTDGSFYYKTIDLNQNIDSAYVNFERKEILGDFYPGDCNKDNLVNHFDIFPIGLMYGKSGSPRNLADTNLSFGVPKKVGDWFFTYKGINAKHADVDGNGLIDENDSKSIYKNFGKSNGTYLPSFSFASKTTKLTFSVADTLDVNSSMHKISIPILIESPSPISAYGLGFSYSVRLFDASNPALSRYYEKTSYQRTNVWDELETLFIIDTVSFPEHINVGYTRKNLVDGELDPQGGVIDITIDEILHKKVHVKVSFFPKNDTLYMDPGANQFTNRWANFVSDVRVYNKGGKKIKLKVLGDAKWKMNILKKELIFQS